MSPPLLGLPPSPRLLLANSSFRLHPPCPCPCPVAALPRIIGFAFTRQPTWLTHLGNHVILEDDNPFLHTQGHTYRDVPLADLADLGAEARNVGASEGARDQLAPGWQRRLYMPSTSDTMVVAFRRWIDRYTDGRGAPWSPHGRFRRSGSGAEAAEGLGMPWRRATREEVLERRASHVAHCSACSGALSNAVKGRRGADAAVVASLMWAALMARWRAPALALAATAYGVGRACESLEHRMTFGVYPPPRNK